jgi:hypothetical protein
MTPTTAAPGATARRAVQTLLLATAVLTAVLGAGGCSIFGQSVDPELRDKLRDAAKPGMPMDEAEAAISSQGFRCQPKHGEFYDEYGTKHDVPKYLWCVERPGFVSFTCQNRDQVFIIPQDGFVDQTYVLRSTTCTSQ